MNLRAAESSFSLAFLLTLFESQVAEKSLWEAHCNLPSNAPNKNFNELQLKLFMGLQKGFSLVS
jgi:hypothetical protein